MKNVMKTRWEDLVMVNYEVDRVWAEQFVPAGCELDLFHGRALVSVVAFRFSKTRLFGVPMPLYRNFAEINLRIYVKRKQAEKGETTSRGVVFIKEVIAHRIPAMIANCLFKENFHVMPVTRKIGELGVGYRWGDEGNGIHQVSGEFASEAQDWEQGSEEEFIGQNYWAYKAKGMKTLVFQVSHRQWKMRRLKGVQVEIDIAKLYGEGWAKHMNPTPSSVFYVDGSEVGVTLPFTC